MLSAKDSKVFKHAPEKERILELDVLRGLAFLAVVFIHENLTY